MYKKVKKIEGDFDGVNKIDEPKIVAMYRIRNEERWIKQSLKYTSEICKEIVILDDCSTDNTLKICKQFSSVVDIYERKEPLPLDEVRDKNILLKMALKRNPDFIVKREYISALKTFPVHNGIFWIQPTRRPVNSI